MDSGDVFLNEEELLRRHKQESKDLQSKVQGLKKSIPKGDKKKKKEVAEEIAKLEDELEEKHKQELAELKVSVPNGNESVDSVPDSDNEKIPEAETQGVRVSRAQKRRNKKDNEAKEREKRIQEQVEKNKEGPRMIELNTIKQSLNSMNLKLYNIPADGNCLYLAINHQLQVTGRPTHSMNELRKVTADFMLKHKEEFLPFMVNELDESEIVSEEQFDSYCKDVATTKLWGGQLELRALSNILKCPIKIIQATGPPTIQGETFKEPELILTYHRHLYRLGEHYNSTMPMNEEEEEDV